jgi:hypothetical protein
MKLITRANVSCPNLDIHKYKKIIVVIQDSRVGITNFSMVLVTNSRTLAFNLEKQFRDFDARPCASTIDSQQ